MIIDLSLAIDDTLRESHPATIDRMSHHAGVDHLNSLLMRGENDGERRFERGERLFGADEVEDGELLSLEVVHASVHMGTHVDAPYHYGSRCEGRPARTIDQMPLEWFMGPGIRLDFVHLSYPQVIGPRDVEAAIELAGRALAPGDIVLIHTGADVLCGTPEYVNRYVGMSPEAVELILDRGVKVIGIDAISLDRPCFDMFGDFLATRDARALWPTHVLGRRREYAQIERLCNLGRIPRPYGFVVHCLPVKIRDAGAGWSRVVAIVDG